MPDLVYYEFHRKTQNSSGLNQVVWDVWAACGLLRYLRHPRKIFLNNTAQLEHIKQNTISNLYTRYQVVVKQDKLAVKKPTTDQDCKGNGLQK